MLLKVGCGVGASAIAAFEVIFFLIFVVPVIFLLWVLFSLFL